MNRIEEQKKINQEAFDNPKPGHYWQEMFCPYFLVLEVIADNSFWVCDKRKEVDNEHWTWDLSQSKLVDKLYFSRVKYTPISGFVADVIVRENCPFVKEWNIIKHDLIQYKKVASWSEVDNLKQEIAQLKQERIKWINSYVSLLLDNLNETTSLGKTYYELISEENPELANNFKKEVAKFVGS